jgi:archaellum component FlaC
MKQCHPIYNTVDDLEKGQKILNKRIETNTLTSQKERELIKEIAQIKNSKPLIIQKQKL